jgi:hypothetical protein
MVLLHDVVFRFFFGNPSIKQQISDAVSRQKLFRLVQIVKRDPAAARKAGEAVQAPAAESSSTSNTTATPAKNNNQTSQQASSSNSNSQSNNPTASASKLVKPSASQLHVNNNARNLKHASLPSALPSVASSSSHHVPTSPELLKNAGSKSGDTSPGLLDFDDDLDAAKSNPTSGIAASGQKIKSSLGKASVAELSYVSHTVPPQMQQQQQHHLQQQQSQVTRVADDDDDDANDDDTAGGGAISSSGGADNSVDDAKIKCCIRKRPINSKEKAKGEVDVAVASQHDKTVCIHEPKQKVDLTKYVESHQFVFDTVFDEQSTNEQIYNDCCKPLISFFLNRGKATCFAYGQTGSGKVCSRMCNHIAYN